MNRELRKDWVLGFFGLFSLIGLRYFQTKQLVDLTWFTWILWFHYFLPVKKEQQGIRSFVIKYKISINILPIEKVNGLEYVYMFQQVYIVYVYGYTRLLCIGITRVLHYLIVYNSKFKDIFKYIDFK